MNLNSLCIYYREKPDFTKIKKRKRKLLQLSKEHQIGYINYEMCQEFYLFMAIIKIQSSQGGLAKP